MGVEWIKRRCVRFLIHFLQRKKGGEGTGLGLALAEQIITSHKGYIYAESKKGEGSTFHIYLPVLDTEHMPQIVQNIPRKDYRIVVADDNAKVLQLLKKNFEKIGIQIQTCMKREELQNVWNSRRQMYW